MNIKGKFTMKNSENKGKKIHIYGEDAVPFLQYVIDGLSNQSIKSATYSIDFSKLKKLKISFKKKYEAPYVKCKVKYEEMDDILIEHIEHSASDRDKPDYKVLKKRLEKSLKTIGDRLKDRGIPSNIEIELFCSNARLMTTYSDHGNYMYPEFLKLISEFQEAFHQFDIQKCLALFADIKAMKKTCHHED
ncbi:MAG: GAK system XXXCH domain-containing protein [Pseudomonadota bacterium]